MNVVEGRFRNQPRTSFLNPFHRDISHRLTHNSGKRDYSAAGGPCKLLHKQLCNLQKERLQTAYAIGARVASQCKGQSRSSADAIQQMLGKHVVVFVGDFVGMDVGCFGWCLISDGGCCDRGFLRSWFPAIAQLLKSQHAPWVSAEPSRRRQAWARTAKTARCATREWCTPRSHARKPATARPAAA